MNSAFLLVFLEEWELLLVERREQLSPLIVRGDRVVFCVNQFLLSKPKKTMLLVSYVQNAEYWIFDRKWVWPGGFLQFLRLYNPQEGKSELSTTFHFCWVEMLKLFRNGCLKGYSILFQGVFQLRFDSAVENKVDLFVL